MPTRGEVAELLSSYAGNLNDFNTRLDRVRRELLKKGNWRGSKVPVILSIFTDVDSYPIVTLPYQFNTLLAGLANPPSTVVSPFCRWPMVVHNGWYETLPWSRGLMGACNSRSFNEVNGRYCTYQDWTSPVQLSFAFETSEKAGKILVQGTNNGVDVYSGSPWAKGEVLSFTGTGTVTTVNSYDARGLYVVKPETQGRVTMSAINALFPPVVPPVPFVPPTPTTGVVGIFAPNETQPKWRRYHVPGLNNPTSNQFLAICKLAFNKLISDNDECVPGDIEALRHGLEALKLGDAHDYVREKQEWAAAEDCLIDQSEDDQGAAATGKIQVEDTFNVGALNAEGYGYGWGWDSDGGYW